MDEAEVGVAATKRYSFTPGAAEQANNADLVLHEEAEVEVVEMQSKSRCSGKSCFVGIRKFNC